MPEGWGTMKVLVKLVGIELSSVSESCTAGGTTASVPCSSWSTMILDFAPCYFLLNHLVGIQVSEMRGMLFIAEAHSLWGCRRHR